MTRKEEIEDAAITYLCGDKSYSAEWETRGFIAGAEWADQNPIYNEDMNLEKEIQAFAKMDLYPIELEDTNESLLITKHQIYKCARHFFELGLKTKENKE